MPADRHDRRVELVHRISGGWIPVSFDLSAYAGQEVEIVVSYVTDPFTGEARRLMVDDTKLVIDGVASEAEGFETDLGAWTVLGAPRAAPPTRATSSATTRTARSTARRRTPDTLLFGFGLEQLATDADRAEVAGGSWPTSPVSR